MEGVNYPTLSHPEGKQNHGGSIQRLGGGICGAEPPCACASVTSVTGMWLEAVLSGWILVL